MLPDPDDVDAVEVVLIDSRDSSYVYAGVGFGDGFLKSTNGGLTWTSHHVAPDTWNSEQLTALAMTELGPDPPVLYSYDIFSLYPDVYKSADRGETWSATGASVSINSPWSP